MRDPGPALLVVPDEVWVSDQMRAACKARDVGQVFRLLRRSYSAGVSAGGSHGPVVKSWRRASSLSMPHLWAVSR